MRPIVLFEVVKNHQSATGPVKMRVKVTDKVSQFGRGRTRPDDRFKLFPFIKAVRESSSSYQREFPMGCEPSDGRDGVRAARSEERIGFIVKFCIYGDNLSHVFRT